MPSAARISTAVEQTQCTTKDGRIDLTPRHEYRLAEMVEQCNLKAPAPADGVVERRWSDWPGGVVM